MRILRKYQICNYLKFDIFSKPFLGIYSVLRKKKIFFWREKGTSVLGT